MATDPIFFTGVYKNQVQFNTANTARDGTGTIQALVDNSGGTDPVRVDLLRLASTGTTTAGKLRFFWHDGTNWRYYTGIDVQAITASATVEPWQAVLRYQEGLIVPVGWKWGIATHNAETFNAKVEGATP